MINTLKLLIVDDEKYIRSLLRYSIDWHELGIEICGEATCAEEGLQLVAELQPNIIFSDICMDYMDGVEFSKQVIQQHPYIKIVLLSGHDKFDYAARGIEAGVSAYLLKPLEEEKIIETIQKIKKIIYHENSQQEELESLKNYLGENKTSLIESNLNALMLHPSDIGAIIKRLNYLDVSFSHPFFQIALVQLAPIEDSIESTVEQCFLLSMECNRILKDLLDSQNDVYQFFDLNHRNIILCNNPNLELLDLLECVKATLLNCFPCTITIGIGHPTTTLAKIRQSYQNAAEAVNYRTILGKNQIILYNSISIEKQDPLFNLEDSIATLLDTIKSEQIDSAFEIVDNCIQNQLAADASDIVPVRVATSTIVNHLSDILLRAGLRNTDAFTYSMATYERIFRLETIDEHKNMLHNLIRSIVETFASIRAEKNNSIIQSILNYLSDHYSDADLTLSSTAKAFYLNSSYLSRLFKFETNTTFTKHLTEIRLNKAAELLTNTSLRAYVISEKVGFRDAKYFSVCFRKHYNMTVNEYRTNQLSLFNP